MYAFVIIFFSFACIIKFVTGLIALIFKDLARKNFGQNLCLQMGECIVYMYRL